MTCIRRHIASTTTPSSTRILVALCATASIASAAVSQAQALSEADVVQLIKIRDPNVQIARASAAASAAQETAARLYPNPSFNWARSHVPGSSAIAERDDALFVTLPIDLSGRRSATLALARSETAQARVDEARTRSDAVVDALSLFYAALAATRRAQIADAAVTRVEEAARVLARRFDQGTASGYERTRIELEAELARSQAREAAARALTDKASLANLLGVEVGRLELQGDLEPLPAISSQPRTSAALAHESVAAAQRATDSAGRAWIPKLEATGGLRILGAQGETDYGYIAGISIDLPLFSLGQELRDQASARRTLASVRAQALERNARLLEQRATQELAWARDERARLERETSERLQQLERAATSAYREGQSSVLELLDAQRTRTAIEHRSLELALSAKRAELAIRAARGEFE